MWDATHKWHRYSPDGSAIAFDDVAGAIGVFDPATDGETRRFGWSNSFRSLFAWAPDGSAIAVRMYLRGESDLKVIDRATGAVRSIATEPGARWTNPVWTRDGAALAVVSFAECERHAWGGREFGKDCLEPVSDLREYGLDGEWIRTIDLGEEIGDQGTVLSISPSARFALIVTAVGGLSHRGHDGARLLLLNLDTGTISSRQWIDDWTILSGEHVPQWSTSEAAVAFAFRGDLVVLRPDVDGKLPDPEFVSFGRDWLEEVAWVPDSECLLLLTKRDVSGLKEALQGLKTIGENTPRKFRVSVRLLDSTTGESTRLDELDTVTDRQSRYLQTIPAAAHAFARWTR